VDVIVIGGGQAGLSVGYHLKRRGVRFVILDVHGWIGDAWRTRWDSLRLFSPARFDGLDGMPFPGDPDAFPNKDQMADYLEDYAARFELPVLTGVKVDRLSHVDARFMVEAGLRRFEAAQVVVAMASHQRPRLPDFARDLAPDLVQVHSLQYKGPAQLRPGGVLIVGAANSGAEIAMDLAGQHPILISGRHPGHVPFRNDGFWARKLLLRLLFWVVFHRILSVATFIGRKVRSKGHATAPLIRQKPRELAAAGVVRVGRTVGARGGRPVLDDGRVLDASEVTNVIWCTGFHPGHSWIDVPIFDTDGHPRHASGVVSEVPGLYFVGLDFLHAMSSSMIHGVGRDADRVAGAVAARETLRRTQAQMPPAERSPVASSAA
jgi:putative flavoprotein involved in K+ transport